MAEKNMFLIFFLIIIMQNIGSLEASRFLNDANKDADDDFFLTKSGPSPPGVGHSEPPSSYNKDDDVNFFPTESGPSSPGVGHPKPPNSYNKDVDGNFFPTESGPSPPGVGHPALKNFI
jgi:hypothetical protein